MNSRMEQPFGGGFLTTRNAWMEGKAPMPTGLHSLFEANLNNLLGFFLGSESNVLIRPEKSHARPVTIINKQSGKALEIENTVGDQFARAHQVARSGEPNQLWFISRAKFNKRVAVPTALFREAHRSWRSLFRFPFPGYSLIAAHSGLCLDVPDGLTEHGDSLQKSPASRPSCHLWAFVPDQQGSNFIVNLFSRQVLDVADSSLKNYAPVHQYPFNGAASQRWQLFSC